MKRAFVLFAVLVGLTAGIVRAQGAPELRIGVFDAGRISEETDEGKKIAGQLTGLRDKKQAEVAAKQKEIQDLQTQLQTQSLSLSPDRRSQMEKDINLKGLELQQLQQKAQNEMQMEVQEAQNRFQEQLLAIIDGFGKDEGFSLIVEKSLVAYSSPSIDVTTALVDRFNKVTKAAAAPAEKPPDKPADKSADKPAPKGDKPAPKPPAQDKDKKN